MTHRLIYGAALSLLCLLASGCSERKFSVEGTVTGASGHSVVLEGQDPVAGWLALDSAVVDSRGDFELSAAAPQYPDIYRLRLGDRYVYLPVDSLEHLCLKSSLRGFDSEFTLSGSPQAEQLTAFEREARKVEAYNNPDSTAAFRKRVFSTYLREAHGNILSYHILNRQMGDGWLIDYTDPLYAAVATAFETYRPSDPHTAQLTARAREGVAARRKTSGTGTRMQATATGMIPITLPGLDGHPVALENLLGKGKPVVVAFVVMTREDTPAVNRHLRTLYNTGRADIYEVCLDTDQFAWREASRQLPWTVVFDPDGDRSPAALKYNVGSVPAFFIYNGAGDLVQSTGDASRIASLL